MPLRRPHRLLLITLLLVLLALLAFGMTRLFGPQVRTLTVVEGAIRQAVVASGKVRSWACPESVALHSPQPAAAISSRANP